AVERRGAGSAELEHAEGGAEAGQAVEERLDRSSGLEAGHGRRFVDVPAYHVAAGGEPGEDRTCLGVRPELAPEIDVEADGQAASPRMVEGAVHGCAAR